MTVNYRPDHTLAPLIANAMHRPLSIGGAVANRRGTTTDYDYAGIVSPLHI